MKAVLSTVGFIALAWFAYVWFDGKVIDPDRSTDEAGQIQLDSDFVFGTVVDCKEIEKMPWFSAIVKMNDREHHVAAASDRMLTKGQNVCVGTLEGTTNGNDMYVVVPSVTQR